MVLKSTGANYYLFFAHPIQLLINNRLPQWVYYLFINSTLLLSIFAFLRYTNFRSRCFQ